jgi:sensor domain DACNV-containing protein
MSYRAYPAGRAVAERVREQFVRHLREADGGAAAVSTAIADPPDVDELEELIDVAFWTSLRREEGYVPIISLALLPPEAAPSALRFALPLTLKPAPLAKVAPAVERQGIHLGVSRIDGQLAVWGATRVLPAFCLVLEVAAPGLLVIKQHRGGEHTKFANIAVLEADLVKIVDERASSLPECPSLLSSLLGFETPASWTDSVNVLVQLSVSMREHKRGGLLLVVPGETARWRESIVSPIAYELNPPFSVLADLMFEKSAVRDRLWEDALGRAIEGIAGLTAVDGATIVTDRHELLAFGAKITRRRGSPPVELTTITEPIEGGFPRQVHPSSLGGTRHLSAAQFVHDQRDAVALVASQDGRFTVFAWSTCEDMVHAHRVEALLL